MATPCKINLLPSWAEIAKELGESVGAVRYTYKCAMQKVEKQLFDRFGSKVTFNDLFPFDNEKVSEDEYE